jgi:hypothetical protein
MKRIIAFSLIAVLVLATAPLAQDQDESMKEMQEWMKKAGATGEHHGHLAKMVGEFAYTAKAWMQPGAEAQEWSGTRKGEMILGGRFLQEYADGNFMGMPFNGMGLWAYDNLAEQYEATWIDNMNTVITRSTGSCSVNGWVMEGKHMVPGTGENAFKNVVRWVDDDTYVFEWYEAIPGQEEMFKTMEITYTRKK